MQNKKFDWLARLEEIPSRIYVIMAVFMLALNTVLFVFTDLDPVVCGIVLILLYGVVSIIVYVFTHRRLKLFRLESNATEEQSQSVIYTFRNQLKLPYAVVNESGKILTANAAFSSAVGTFSSLFNLDINTLCSIKFAELVDISSKKMSFADDSSDESYEEIPIKDIRKAEIAEIKGRKFRMECYPLASKGKTYYMVVFHDITELAEITKLHHDKHAVIGYIVIDNLEEIAQYVKVSYQDENFLPRRQKYSGWIAQIIQHEIDHCNGVII